MTADKTLADANAVAERAAKKEAARLASDAKKAEAEAAKLAKQAAETKRAEADRRDAEAAAASLAQAAPLLTWAELEPKVRELERSTAKDDSHRRIVRVALRQPPTDPLYLGDMGSAPITYADDVDQVQWSDGTWQPIVAAEAAESLV